MKKYELTENAKMWLGHELHQIRALVSFGSVQAGDLGGWIEKEQNLSHDGDACVCDSAGVYGDACVNEDRHILTVGPIGSRKHSTTTFFHNKDGRIMVACGCFRGDIDEFAAAVQKTHGDNEHARAYALAIELAKLRIRTEQVED